jgi:hypothetical protein
MRTQNHPFRLTATVAIAALLVPQTLPQPAMAALVLAQTQPQPVAQGAPPQDQQQSGDPPSRVGRLAQVSGTVSFHTQDDTQWNPATLNYPVTQGDAFWTEPNAQAVLEVSASRIAMAPGTELDVTTLTDHAFQATLPQGELYLRVRTAAPDETFAVQTPRGVVTLSAPGRYGVLSGDTQAPTTVTVIEGSAQVLGPGVALNAGPDQVATVTGVDAFQGEVGPAQRDAFLTAMLNSERPPQPPAAAPPAAVAAMPGGEDLAQYGSWTESPDYGQVWYPQVGSDWVPYREGRWAYVAPWGWTWVDNEPWGFAPFHYGRWAEIGGRWGWVPGGVAVGVPEPVYAPALVTFLGVGAVVGVGIGAALAAGRIGWCPLGPREAFHPWYRASDRYFHQVNVSHVTNFTTINRNVTFNNFVNRRAATVVPTAAMTGSRPVASSFQRVDPAQLAQARPVIGQQPLRPAPTTFGVTPAAARQLNLPPATGQHPVAPGPGFRATPAVVSPGAAAGVTAHPGVPGLHNPAQPAVPAAGVRPFTETPHLATPGAPGGIPGPAITPHPGAPAFAAPGATPGLRPPGSTGPTGQPFNRLQSTTAVPGAVPHLPPGASPGGVQPTPTPFHATPSVVTPAPQVHTPPPGAIQQPAAPFHAMPAAPPPVVHAPEPPVMTHAAPPVAPPPQVHVPPAQAFHPAPPPPPVAHVVAPPPQFHASPPPAAAQFHPPPAPQVHAPPPPPPPQNAQHKRPGEP